MYSVYRIVCKDITITECYVGSTTNIDQRKREHKSRCYNEKDNHYYLKIYTFIRNHGDWDNWNIELLEGTENGREREQYWIDHFNPSLNSCVAVSNDEHLRKLRSKSYHRHKEKHFEKNRITSNEHYEKNKEHYTEKFDCECGGRFTRKNRGQHLKTPKHFNFVQNQNILSHPIS